MSEIADKLIDNFNTASRDVQKVRSTSNLELFMDAWNSLSGYIEELESRIAELEAAQRQNWTPVSERLPEANTPVLTISKDNNEPVTAWLEDNFWWSSVDWSLSVTHWMPLPQPPEVQE